MNPNLTYFYVELVSNDTDTGNACHGSDGTANQVDHAVSQQGHWNIYWYGPAVAQDATHTLELRYVNSS